MLGTISIADLEIRTIVGILPHERENEQNIYLDIELDRDFAEAERTEDVQHTVDYAEVSRVLSEWVQAEKFWLIETLAERGCRLLFERWPEITRAKITVKKPDAVKPARYTAVSVERSSSGS